MKLAVYVAAPFAERRQAIAVHERLTALDIDWTSTWVEDTFQGEPPREHCRTWAVRNDDDIARSHALLVLAIPSTGGERFAEVSRALLSGIPIVWTGERILSTHRDGVLLVPSVDEALGVLVSWARMAIPGTGVEADNPPSGPLVRERIWNAVIEAHALAERVKATA
jgi:hypothetical protein